jgi:hypothetical protein
MAATYITMIIVLGIVWGGLILVVSQAVKMEKQKEKNGEER